MSQKYQLISGRIQIQMDIKQIAQLYQWEKSLHHQQCFHLGPQDISSSHAMHFRQLNAKIEAFKTNWMSFFPERFVPFQACHKYQESGLEAVEPKDYFQNQKSYKFALLHQRLSAKVKPQVSISYAIVPFDMYCPSLDGKLEKVYAKYVVSIAFSSRNDTSSKMPPQDHRYC